jgi:hypothetical protein
MYAGYNILVTGFYLDMHFNISYGALEKTMFSKCYV